jgi:ribosomal protein L21
MCGAKPLLALYAFKPCTRTSFLYILLYFSFTDVKVGLLPYVKDVVLKGDVIDKKRDDRILHKKFYFKNI